MHFGRFDEDRQHLIQFLALKLTINHGRLRSFYQGLGDGNWAGIRFHIDFGQGMEYGVCGREGDRSTSGS